MRKRSTKLHEKLRKRVLSDPALKTIYDEFTEQLELAEKLKKARQKSKLTQENVAEKMKTTTSAIARLEAGGGKEKHSPSLLTLQRYATALGYRLKISLQRISKTG